MTIRALLFDFDGLMLDTELAIYDAWAALYREHGHELEVERWGKVIGTAGGFDPVADLTSLTGKNLDRERLFAERRELILSASDELELKEGVHDYLVGARERGLLTAIVTSDHRRWIDRHLERLELSEGWDCIVCADGDHGRAKPSPTLYLAALDELGVDAAEAIALEDSENGVAAATASGIFTVAVPHRLTAHMDLSAADVVVDSLSELPLGELLRRAAQTGGGSG